MVSRVLRKALRMVDEKSPLAFYINEEWSNFELSLVLEELGYEVEFKPRVGKRMADLRLGTSIIEGKMANKLRFESTLKLLERQLLDYNGYGEVYVVIYGKCNSGLLRRIRSFRDRGLCMEVIYCTEPRRGYGRAWIVGTFSEGIRLRTSLSLRWLQHFQCLPGVQISFEAEEIPSLLIKEGKE